MRKAWNLMELFSGIGSQAKALNNLNVQINTVGTCEWDYHAFVAYDAIHNSTKIPGDIEKLSKPELLEKLLKYTLSNNGKTALAEGAVSTYSEETLKRIYAAIIRSKNFVDIMSLNGNEMPDHIDILTYSFPCQDLSNVGAFHGYNKGIDRDSGSRSSLLWQVGRILAEMKADNKTLPGYLLMENVPTLLSKRHKENFDKWIKELSDLGYISRYYQLNASDFGQPQNRPRLLMISAFAGDDKSRAALISDFFEKKDASSIVDDYKLSGFYKRQTVQSCLRIDYKNIKIFDEAVECTPNDTISRRAIWNENPQIIRADNTFNEAIDVVRTITTKQDRNPNSGNLFFDSGIAGRGKFRYLTPRECLLFMGFTDNDYDNLKAANSEYHKGDALFARDKIIRMAGNSIPVKLLEGIFWQIILLDKKLGDENGCS